MIIVRETFHVKFGQTKEATRLFKEAIALMQKQGSGSRGIRLLTDLAGPPYYTLIMEDTYESLAKWEEDANKMKHNTEFPALYQKLIPLIDSGHREFLKVVE